MVIKINYTSSDVYVSTSVSPVYVVVNYSAVNNGGGGAIWGGITGTLSDQTDLQDALDDKVPYTGATTNVNLGEYELKAGQMTLDTTPTGTAAVGTTRWNDTIGSSETTLKGGSVILKNGIDLVARIVNKVTPNTTLTKAAYQAVRVSGAQGQRLAVALAQANNDANSADTIGLVTETIATNQEGFIMTVGQLENINTTGSLQGETWADGDVLYLSPTTAGVITKVKPTGNGHIVVIGYVEYAHANNGKIYVKVMNGWELDELHDVSIVSPANNEALIYESSTSLWKNKTIATALGYTPISGSGTSGQVAYWNGTSSQTGSNNLFWDAANSGLVVGNNVLSSFFRLGVNGNIVVSGTSPYITFNTATNSGSTPAYIQFTNATSKFDIVSTGAIEFFSNANARMRLFGTGNLGINTGSTDGGQRLQVQGDAFIRGSGATSATNALLVQNTNGSPLLNIQNNGLTIVRAITNNDSTNIFGVVQQNGNARFTVNGLGQTLISGDGNSATDVMLRIDRQFNPTSGTATHTTTLLIPTINQTGGANGITRGLYVNPILTAAADWRSIEWSNNSGWGLYGAGTAPNYLGGKLVIGTTTVSTFALDVNGTARVSDILTVSKNQNAGTYINISNTTNNIASGAGLVLTSNSAHEFQIYKYSLSTSGYKILASSDAIIFNNGGSGDIAIFNDFGTGKIKFATGSSSTVQFSLKPSGSIRFHPMATPPALTTEAGDVYYDSFTNKLRCYNGTSWNDLF